MALPRDVIVRLKAKNPAGSWRNFEKLDPTIAGELSGVFFMFNRCRHIIDPYWDSRLL